MIEWGYSPKPANTKANEVTLPLSYDYSYISIIQGIKTTSVMRLDSDSKTLSYFKFDSHYGTENKYAGYWFTLGYLKLKLWYYFNSAIVCYNINSLYKGVEIGTYSKISTF